MVAAGRELAKTSAKVQECAEAQICSGASPLGDTAFQISSQQVRADQDRYRREQIVLLKPGDFFKPAAFERRKRTGKNTMRRRSLVCLSGLGTVT